MEIPPKGQNMSAKRTVEITVLLTPDEKDQIRRQARALSIPMGAYLRMIALRQPVAERHPAPTDE